MTGPQGSGVQLFIIYIYISYYSYRMFLFICVAAGRIQRARRRHRRGPARPGGALPGDGGGDARGGAGVPRRTNYYF